MRFDLQRKIILENKRVKLEPLSFNHLNSLLLIAKNNPNLLKYSPSKFGNREFLKEYIESALNSKSTNKRYPFAIFDKVQNKYVGSTSYGNISNNDKRLEIGWTWLGTEFQGTGLNKHCKYLLLKFAFDKLKFERIELKTDSRNLQSRKAIEKIGGKFEGELRSHTLMLDGHRRNTVYYSILKNEWEITKNTIFGEIKTAHNTS